ncbi:MAG: VirB3 family type IV secretion system protein [Acidobacteriaceae bacterium]|nr:VirB3 family type IV secretion system protein [Acidobacteriaceae bacterium]
MPASPLHEQRAVNDQSRFDYRSLNRVPTALGIERKACVFGGMLAFLHLHLGGGLLASSAIFLAYWGIIFALSQWEPRIFRMLPALWRQKRFYSAGKFTAE